MDRCFKKHNRPCLWPRMTSNCFAATSDWYMYCFMLKPIYCCYNVNLHYKSDQHWKLAGEDLGRKQKYTNKSTGQSCQRPHCSFCVIPWGQERSHRRNRWDDEISHGTETTVLHWGWEGSTSMTSIFFLQPPKTSSQKPYNNTWELWYSLFVCSRDKIGTWKIHGTTPNLSF